MFKELNGKERELRITIQEMKSQIQDQSILTTVVSQVQWRALIYNPLLICY